MNEWSAQNVYACNYKTLKDTQAIVSFAVCYMVR